MTSPRSASSAAPASVDRLVQSVYESIKEGILSNRLRPGNKLTNQQIAESLGVSRTPVRESLERLYQEGYVTRVVNRGYFVSDIGAGEVRELYETREALELYALDRVLEEGTSRSMISGLKKINARYRLLCMESLSRERLLVDREFHLALSAPLGNAYLHRSLAAIFDRLILKRRIEGFHDMRGLVPYEDHVRIIDDLVRDDGPNAKRVLRDHIRGACTRFTQYLEPKD